MADIENLINEIKQSTDYQINKRTLKEKIQSDLHLAHNGGLFKVSQELIAFLSSWDSDDVYLEDTYGNPVKIDRQTFLDIAKSHYQKVMNYWHIEHEKIKRARKV